MFESIRKHSFRLIFWIGNQFFLRPLSTPWLYLFERMTFYKSISEIDLWCSISNNQEQRSSLLLQSKSGTQSKNLVLSLNPKFKTRSAVLRTSVQVISPCKMKSGTRTKGQGYWIYSLFSLNSLRNVSPHLCKHPSKISFYLL